MANKKVLIAYGTRYGSTRTITNEINSYLIKKGADVDILDVKKNKLEKDITSYDLVIVGSSVAMFRWLGKVKKFLKNLKGKDVPLVVFISCGTAIDNPEKAQQKFIDKIIKNVGVNPILTQPIEPCLDFTPGSYLTEKKKNTIKGTIKAIAKDRYNENGLMDLRNMDRFNAFLEKIGNLI